jgi:TonB family protein
VIIVQQAGEETGLEGSELLTGHPVYTVYFEVPGAPRRWMLEYCVPGSDGRTFTQPSEGVIHILPKRTVQPPYPIDRIPVSLQGYQGQTRRLVVYAVVNERGETTNVRLIRGTGQDVDERAVTTLRQWTFRPAMRGETPVAIEALFGIPLQ